MMPGAPVHALQSFVVVDVAGGGGVKGTPSLVRRSWHMYCAGTTVERNVNVTEPPLTLFGDPAFVTPSGPERTDVDVASGAAKFQSLAWSARTTTTTLPEPSRV